MKAITRRDFLKYTLGGAACACCPAAWGRLGENYVYAQSMSGLGRTAVYFNQFGGNDPLNSFMIPYTRGAYYEIRPTLSIAANTVLPMAGGVGLNPALTGIHALYQAGDVAVIQGVGDPIGTRSHFTSQEIFSKGISDIDTMESRGWIGRLGDLYFDNIQFNTLGLGVGQQTDFVANRAKNRPMVSSRLSNFGFEEDWTGERDNTYRLRTIAKLLSKSKAISPREKSARDSTRALHLSVEQLEDVVSSYSGALTYPNSGPGNFFREVAMVAEYGLGTQVVYGGMGGWDNHSDQRNSQNGLLASLNSAVTVFANDLKRMGKWNDVVLCIFTEFGRNTFENASHGTDHGWGGAMVLIGGAVKGGVYGATMTDNELRNEPWVIQDIDFRNVFAKSISWLGYNPDPVFPEAYSKINLNIL